MDSGSELGGCVELGERGLKVASSFRNSTGKSMTAGLILRPASRSLVALTPACMAGRGMMSVPGKPICAARRAKSGQGTRPCNRTLFKERNMLRSSEDARQRAKARASGTAASSLPNDRLDIK